MDGNVDCDGEAIIISGMSLKLPKANNVQEFADNLYNKRVCTEESSYRYGKSLNPDLPKRMGLLQTLTEFDAGYFGISLREATYMDPMCRMLMECTYEAILDAGLNVLDFKGTKTAICIGASTFENEDVFYSGKPLEGTFCIVQGARSVVASRLHFWLQTKGCGITEDTACASSHYCIEDAYKLLKYHDYDYAIVAASNLCTNPVITLQFARLGVLCKDGICKSFDENANGYVRSEGIAVVILQKAKTSKRIYAEIVHAKVNCDGYKSQGITFPSSETQKLLLNDCYKECGIEPSTITYVEAHGTGTNVGDPEELNTIDEVFCTGRKRPLHIGSVKSNIGHNEPVAGLCGIAKVIIGFHTGLIPPNVNFSKPRSSVKAFSEKKLIVVTDPTKWPDNNGLVGVSSFGFGGANGHVIIRKGAKNKVNHGMPEDHLARLVCVAARTEESLRNMLVDLSNRPLDAEYVALYHNMFRKQDFGMNWRGYVILNKNSKPEESQHVSSESYSQLLLHFGAEETQIPSCLKHLQHLHTFPPVWQQFRNTFKKLGLKLDTVDELVDQKNSLHVALGTLVAQVFLWETFNALKMSFANVHGVGIGTLTAYYAKQLLTIEQATSLAYYYAIQSKGFEEDEFQKKIGVLIPQQHVQKLVDSLLCKNLTDFVVPHDSYVVSCGKLRQSLEESHWFKLLDRPEESVQDFLKVVGKLFLLGSVPDLARIYPPVSFPVSLQTPMISSLVRWNHDHFFEMVADRDHEAKTYKRVHIETSSTDWAFLQGHVIDGRNLLPATAFLFYVWELFAAMHATPAKDFSIVFHNVKFIRAVSLPKDGEVILDLLISPITGQFEVREGDMTMVAGKVSKYQETDQTFTPLTIDHELEMKTKDVYKELRLRSYNYSGLFKSIREYSVDGSLAKIEWNSNWISYLDNLLQVLILNVDTRNLYIPTGIQQLTIDVKSHEKLVHCCSSTQEDHDPVTLPVSIDPLSDIVRSGGVELIGLHANAISKRKPRGEPVLESYKFVPNVTSLTLEESLRVNTQIVLENVQSVKVKVAEVLSEDEEEPISTLLLNALTDLPLIQPDITVYSKKPIELEKINVCSDPFQVDENLLLYIGTDLLQNQETVTSALKPNTFVLSKEGLDNNLLHYDQAHLKILTIHEVPNKRIKIVLLRKLSKLPSLSVIALNKNVQGFNWLPKVQKAILDDRNVLICSQDQPINGVLGFVNCLRKESNGNKVRCLLLDHSAPKLDLKATFYKKQLGKDLAINVYQNGQWGTYRHFFLNDPIKSKKQAKHCYANVKVPGDLSSLTWIEGSLNQDVLNEIPPVKIYYSALNFRDVMTASGRIVADAKNRVDETCFLGLEYSGVDENGIRLMGMTKCAAIASEIVPDPHLSWIVPADWTLADAATVPVVYATCLYAMVVVGRIKRGNSILIHSGTGGVGQAAINIALHYGCKIFTTVGTEEKKQFVLAKFPQIPESHIGNSRDTSFEEMVMNQTDGRGVDLVLNSLTEEKLQASVRCLSYGGRFLEIGKFDLQSNNGLDHNMLTDAKSFNGVCLDKFFAADAATKKRIYDLLRDGLDFGMVKPLVRTIFSNEKVEEAFRHMATGKHIGKVLISVRNEDKSEALPNCLPRFYCNPEHCSIILGGLGGFGLELADWLVIRGARKLVLTSRRGITNGYQRYRIQIWKNYGAEVVVRTDDVTTEEGCAALIRAANKWAPIENIFNLAVVLRDKTFENQTEEDFQTSLAPKAFATQHLDKITRTNCDNLRNFIVFSSVSCGRGNGGQTNYGMANSIMERICEQRRQDNLPGIAIQWGAVGDVGLVAEVMDTGNELVIGGTLQQKISNCLEVLDSLMNQTEPVVASMVVAEKKLGSGNESVIEAVANILGIRDLKTVSPHVKLPEIGMDSMMGVEIKQTLEREYDVFLTPQDIRNLTFARLREIVEAEKEDASVTPNQSKLEEGMQLLLRFVIEESETHESVVKLSTSNFSKKAPTVFFLPGYEGTSKIFANLCSKLYVSAVCFQYSFEEFEDTITDMARNILPRMLEKLGNSKNFVIIAHSFGTLVALEVASMLEEHGYVGKLILIDGAPQMVKQLIDRQFPEDLSDNDVHITLLFRVLTHMFTLDLLLQHKPDLEKYPTYEGKVDFLIENLPLVVNHSKRYQRLLAMSLYKRLLAMKAYKPSFSKIRSEVHLYKASIQPFEGSEEDFGLSELCHQPIHVKTFEGDHVSVLENEEVAAEINQQFSEGISDKVPIVNINRTNNILEMLNLVEH